VCGSALLSGLRFSSPLFRTQKPANLRAQSVREGLKFEIENMAMIIFDFGNRGSVDLNPEPGKSA
jgi:hypothetical protein